MCGALQLALGVRLLAAPESRRAGFRRRIDPHKLAPVVIAQGAPQRYDWGGTFEPGRAPCWRPAPNCKAYQGGAVIFASPVIILIFAASLAVTGCATVPDATEAHHQVDRAADVINQMNSQPATATVLRDAKAVLIVPEYAKAAFVLGEQGGEGVLLTQRAGHWSDPTFYDVGGVSIGAQAGVEVGPVAYVLMTPRAVQEFGSRDSKSTLSADAGLVAIKFSIDANMASSPRDRSVVSSFPTADVVLWTGTAGLFGGVALASSHVVADQALDKAYHAGPAR